VYIATLVLIAANTRKALVSTGVAISFDLEKALFRDLCYERAETSQEKWALCIFVVNIVTLKVCEKQSSNALRFVLVAGPSYNSMTREEKLSKDSPDL
jgi:hypothetical protein